MLAFSARNNNISYLLFMFVYENLQHNSLMAMILARLCVSQGAKSAAAAAGIRQCSALAGRIAPQTVVPALPRQQLLAMPSQTLASAVSVQARGFRSGVTKSSVKKRFRLKPSGAVVRHRNNKRHLNMNKSSARLNRLSEFDEAGRGYGTLGIVCVLCTIAASKQRSALWHVWHNGVGYIKVVRGIFTLSPLTCFLRCSRVEHRVQARVQEKVQGAAGRLRQVTGMGCASLLRGIAMISVWRGPIIARHTIRRTP